MEIKLRKFLGIDFVVDKEIEGFLWLIPNEMLILYDPINNAMINNIVTIKFESNDSFIIYLFDSNEEFTPVVNQRKYIFSESDFKIFTSYVDYLKFKNKIELIR